jgi:hypothetical protein
MIVRENHQNGRKFTVAARSCCLRSRGSSIYNLSFLKAFVFKNISAARDNSRTWNLAFEFAGK